jgi:hypothetical protein
MKCCVSRLIWAVVFMAMIVMASPPAFAQGGATSTLTGTVVDTSGGVVPGADVVVKSVTTGTVYTAVSGTDGAFTIPAIPPGTYTATISLQGFKTVELKDIVINVAVGANVKAVLELGEIKETVVVTGATEIVQTQTTSVAATINMKQIANLPIVGRGAFDLVNYMPGVNSTTGSARDGTVNGLPQSSVNITLDGMNIQDNYAKSWDGMFTRVSPRLDAVEEVTISTAASGADMSGQGAVQMRMVTRSGTNRYVGSAYYYFRRDWMNTNTWFNLHRNVDPMTSLTPGKPTAKPPVVQYQPGVRFGGPIIKDKLFFFINYEWVKTPGTNGSTRTILSENAQQGLFQYGAGAVNVLTVAAANNQLATIDPTISKLLAEIRSTTTCGTCTLNAIAGDLTQQSLFWQQPTKGQTKYPTLRLDYNITAKHRVSASITQNHLISDPDTTNSAQMVFPGFPVHGLQDSYRWTAQLSLRSVLTKNMVNEVRLGGTGGATFFSPDLSTDMFSSDGIGNMNGYAIGLGNFRSLSSPYPSSAHSAREGSTRVVEDTLSWLKGRHSLAMGASFTRGQVWQWNQQLVPTVGFGVVTGDSADTMFNTTNFPGASSTELGYARNLYALLTGRVSALGREARIGDDGTTYTILGPSNQYGRIWQIGSFLQDSWRLRPDLTVNGGLRWEVQLPFYSMNNSYSTSTVNDLFGITGPGSNLVVGSTQSNIGNMFQPGVLQGARPTYQMLEKGVDAYKTDWNNVAPSIGAAWTIGAEKGLWHSLLGAHGDSVIRGGYNIAYQRGGMSDFTEVYGGNPGILIDATRNSTNQNLGTLPLLLRSGDLSAPNIPLTRTYPMSVPSQSSNIRIFDPNIRLPWAATGTLGIQRALAKNMALELRYIHSDSHDGWTLANLTGQLNYNEVDITGNNFLNEFRLMQANYAVNSSTINPATGKVYGNTFAYTGAAGTSPLPIALANLNGLGGSTNYNDPAKYSGNNWTNSTLLNYLNAYNPNPQSFAGNLRTNYKSNMIASGLPENFWVVNPDVTNAYVVTNGLANKYNGIQAIFTRRMSNGLMVQGNYTFGKGDQSNFYSFLVPYVWRQQTYSNSNAGSGNINHNLAVNWVYELPFGQGKPVASTAGPVLNRVIGNWSFAGTLRLSSGRKVDFGNVRLIGFTQSDLQSLLKVRMVTDPSNQYRTLVYWLPQDIIDNTILAYSTTAAGYSGAAPTGRYFAPANSPSCLETVSGYGDCGSRSVVVTGPHVFRVDVNFDKQIPIKGRVSAQFQIMIFNLFNNVNFNPVTGLGSTLSSYEITGAIDQSRTMQLAFRVNF